MLIHNWITYKICYATSGTEKENIEAQRIVRPYASGREDLRSSIKRGIESGRIVSQTKQVIAAQKVIAQSQAQQQELIAAYKTLEPYISDGKIDLSKAMKEGVDVSRLVKAGIIAQSDIDNVNTVNEVLTKLEPYKVKSEFVQVGEDGEPIVSYDIVKYIQEHPEDKDLLAKVFSEDALGKAIETGDILKALEPYKIVPTDKGFEYEAPKESQMADWYLKQHPEISNKEAPEGLSGGSWTMLQNNQPAYKVGDKFYGEDGKEITQVLKAADLKIPVEGLRQPGVSYDIAKYLIDKGVANNVYIDATDKTPMLNKSNIDVNPNSDTYNKQFYDYNEKDGTAVYRTPMGDSTFTYSNVLNVKKLRDEQNLVVGGVDQYRKDLLALGYSDEGIKYSIALARLEPYKTPDGKYNIADYLSKTGGFDPNSLYSGYDTKGDWDTLRAIGLSDDEIKKIENYVTSMEYDYLSGVMPPTFPVGSGGSPTEPWMDEDGTIHIPYGADVPGANLSFGELPQPEVPVGTSYGASIIFSPSGVPIAYGSGVPITDPMTQKFEPYIATVPESMPEFGTPEYTQWYYDNPEAPGYIEGRLPEYDIEKIIKALNKNEIERSDVEIFLGKGTIELIDKINQQVEQNKKESLDAIGLIASNANVGLLDKNNLTVEEMKQLIDNGLDPKVLVINGQDLGKIQKAIDDIILRNNEINQKYQEYQSAYMKLTDAGFSIPKEGEIVLGEGKSLTVANLAEFQRNNPQDSSISVLFGQEFADKVNQYNQSLKDGIAEINAFMKTSELGAKGTAIDNIFLENDITFVPKDTDYDMRLGTVVDTKTGEILTPKEVLARKWAELSDEQRELVTNALAKDPTKSNYFAALNRTIGIVQEKGGLVAGLIFTPVTGVTNVISKALTLDEAKKILSESYATELESVKAYVNKDGTVDIGKLKDKLNADAEYREQVLKDAGYDKVDDLTQNLEYYNNGVQITKGEIAEATAIGALDLLALGGASALAGLGLGGRIAATGVQVASAGVFVPNSIKTITSPKASMPEKVLAGATPILLIAGGALGLKAPSMARVSPIGKVEVPVKGVAIAEGLGEAVSKTKGALGEARLEVSQAKLIPRMVVSVEAGFKAVPRVYENSVIKVNNALENINTLSDKVMSGEFSNVIKADIRNSLVVIKNEIPVIKQAIGNGYEASIQRLNSGLENINVLADKIMSGELSASVVAQLKNAGLVVRGNLAALRDQIGIKYEASIQKLNSGLENINVLADKIMSGELSATIKNQLIESFNKVKEGISELKTNVGKEYEVGVQKLNEVLEKVNELSDKVMSGKVGKEITDTLKGIGSEIRQQILDGNRFVARTTEAGIQKVNEVLEHVNTVADKVMLGKYSDNVKNIFSGIKNDSNSLMARIGESYELKIQRLNDVLENINVVANKIMSGQYTEELKALFVELKDKISQLKLAIGQKYEGRIQALNSGLENVNVIADKIMRFDLPAEIRGAIDDFKYNVRLARFEKPIKGKLSEVNVKVDSIGKLVDETKITDADINGALSKIDSALDELSQPRYSSELSDVLLDLRNQVSQLKPLEQVSGASIPISGTEGISPSTGVIGSFKTVKSIVDTLKTKGGILPAGLKTGGQDLAYVRIPDLFKGIEGKVNDIILKLPPDKQAGAIRALLNPENQIKFDAYMELVDIVKQNKIPSDLINNSIDFTNVEVIKGNRNVANGFKEWLQLRKDDVIVGGSVSRLQQLKDVEGVPTPHDFDLYIKKGSKLTTEQATQELANTIKKNAPDADVKVEGTKLKINGEDTSDIHIQGYAGINPYGMPSLMKPIVIDGISFVPLQESIGNLVKTVTSPAVGKSAGLMGPKAGELFNATTIGEFSFGTVEGRVKDIGAVNVIFRGIADSLERNNPKLASEIKEALYKIQYTPSGKPFKGVISDTVARDKFLDLVAKAHEVVLTEGKKAIIIDPETGGTLVRITSPASEIVPNTLYHASRNINEFIEDIKNGKVEVNKLKLYTSPDVAFDFLIDRETGIMPKEAGIVAIRFNPAELGNNIKSVSRFERNAKGEMIAYDELTLNEGLKLNVTKPTDLTISKRGISGGITGETLTYYPRTKTSVSMLWFATDSAKSLGFGAPSLTEVQAINWLAFKAMITNILHPHLNTDIKFTWGDTKAVKGDLIDFYRDTLKWKNAKEQSVKNNIINKESAILEKEAVGNLERKGLLKDATLEERQRLINDETNNIIKDRVENVMKNQKVMEELAKTSSNKFAEAFVVDVKALSDSLNKVGIVGGLTSGFWGTSEAETLGETASLGGKSQPIMSYSLSEAMPSSITKASGEPTSSITLEELANSFDNSIKVVEEPISILGVTEPTIPKSSFSTIETSQKPIEALLPTTIQKEGIPTIISLIETTTRPTEITSPFLTTEPPTDITTEIPTEITTETPRPPKPPKTPRVISLSLDEQKKKNIIENPPAGTLCWIQGRPTYKDGTTAAMYKVIVPPYQQEDMFTTREIPYGYKDEGYVGKGSAFKSLQVLGGLPPNKIENIDLGFVRINVDIENGKPVISYVHDTDANVGARSETVGMGRGQIPVEAWDEAKAQGVSYEDFINSYRGKLVGQNGNERIEPQIEVVNSEEKIIEPEIIKEEKVEVAGENLENNPDLVIDESQIDELNVGLGEESAGERLNKNFVIKKEGQLFDELVQDQNAELKESAQNMSLPLIVRGLEKDLRYQFGKRKVYAVDGDYIRTILSKKYPELEDFTQGGEWKAYPRVIPEWEYWVDNVLKPSDFKATAIHEIVEPDAMGAGRGKSSEEYEDAHTNVANVIEYYARDNPRLMDSILSKALQGKYESLLREANKYSPRVNRIEEENVDAYDIENVEETVVKPKKPKKMADWWDDSNYASNGSLGYNGKVYRGRELLTPSISGEL